ncbi:MAG TPA: hypothetical protein DEB39_05165 [Planctomycetaceae bacterium]|nr:hypothetical protein [Planctomycetaceae bacterium]
MAVFSPQFADYLLRKDAARRPLDWRYQRAIALSRLIARKRYPRSGDDALVSQYADLLHRLNFHSTFEDFARIRKRHPDLIEVHVAYATLNKTELALLDGVLLSQSPDPTFITNQTGLTDRQQQLYRRMFLDVEDRRKMSLFIATQLMEPSRLRGTALGSRTSSTPESPDKQAPVRDDGTLPLRAQCTLRVIGFYSSPIVMELLYTGFLSGTIPCGRDSALRYMVEATLTNIRRHGLFASVEAPFDDKGLLEVFKLASKLAMEEKEEGQIDIIQNIEALFAQFRPRIGVPGTILGQENLPTDVFEGAYELTEDEMVATMQTGKLPQSIIALHDSERKFE